MIDAVGNPKVLEFNCRMGDPETQPIIVRLKSDLVDLFEHAVERHARHGRRRNGIGARRSGVVLAAAGYPDAPRKGDVITGLPDQRQTRANVIQTCTCTMPALRWTAQSRSSTGGRVLCVTALGDSVRQAQRAAYAAVREHPVFAGCNIARDIGHRALVTGKALTACAGSGSIGDAQRLRIAHPRASIRP